MERVLAGRIYNRVHNKTLGYSAAKILLVSSVLHSIAFNSSIAYHSLISRNWSTVFVVDFEHAALFPANMFLIKVNKKNSRKDVKYIQREQ